jgi:acetyl-CoA synthetase
MDRHGIATFDKLMERSPTDLEWFWNAVIEDLDIEFYEPHSQVVDLSQGIADLSSLLNPEVVEEIRRWQGTNSR